MVEESCACGSYNVRNVTKVAEGGQGCTDDGCGHADDDGGRAGDDGRHARGDSRYAGMTTPMHAPFVKVVAS